MRNDEHYVTIRSHLAGYTPSGRIVLNPHIPEKWRGISMRKRVRRHERVELHLRKKLHDYDHAHDMAVKAEHKGLSKKQIQQYEGKLGSISRLHPLKNGGVPS